MNTQPHTQQEAPRNTSAPSPAHTPVPTQPIIHAQNLSIAYAKHAALQNVNLAIQPNRITALVGPSGCGKTSFLQAINRLTDLIPTATVTGSLTIAGQNVLDPTIDTHSLRRRVGMIFQKPNPFPLSIAENIHLALREHGIRSKQKRNEITEHTLRRVGLLDEVADRLHKPAASLSGGQQQRLCIARALALNPDILLLDEPCSALDPISSGIVEDLITQLRQTTTIVIVTHNLAQAKRIADQLAVFWNRNNTGTLIEAGPAKQLFGNPADLTTAAYLSGSRG